MKVCIIKAQSFAFQSIKLRRPKSPQIAADKWSFHSLMSMPGSPRLKIAQPKSIAERFSFYVLWALCADTIFPPYKLLLVKSHSSSRKKERNGRNAEKKLAQRKKLGQQQRRNNIERSVAVDSSLHQVRRKRRKSEKKSCDRTCLKNLMA